LHSNRKDSRPPRQYPLVRRLTYESHTPPETGVRRASLATTGDGSRIKRKPPTPLQRRSGTPHRDPVGISSALRPPTSRWRNWARSGCNDPNPADGAWRHSSASELREGPWCCRERRIDGREVLAHRNRPGLDSRDAVQKLAVRGLDLLETIRSHWNPSLIRPLPPPVRMLSAS
jgi:hypothetical protein